MARVKKSRRRASGEWVTSITRPQRHKRKARGRHDPAERALYGLAQLPDEASRERGRKLVLWLGEFGPELLDQHLSLRMLAQVPWPNAPRDKPELRPVEDLRQLVDRLLARFPIPPVLHGAFLPLWLPKDARLNLAKTAALLGDGGSFRDAQRRGWLPPSATKRIVRAFLASPAGLSPGQAWRRAQAVGQGLPAWVGSAVGRRNHNSSLWEQDLYWRQTIHWLGKHCQSEPEIAAVVGYLRLHPIELAGRTRASVFRLVEEWDQLRMGAAPPTEDAAPWRSAGLDPRLVEPGWELVELNRPWDLYEEGRLMRHCVWGYRSRVAAGLVSIWSLRFEGQRRVTVELSPRLQLLQVRGVMNRNAQAEEWRVLRAWVEGLRMQRTRDLGAKSRKPGFGSEIA